MNKVHDAGAKGDAEGAVGHNHRGHVNGQEVLILEGGHQRLHVGREEGDGDGHKRQHHRLDKGAEGPLSVPALEYDVEQHDAAGEGDGELPHVGPGGVAHGLPAGEQRYRQESRRRPGRQARQPSQRIRQPLEGSDGHAAIAVRGQATPDDPHPEGVRPVEEDRPCRQAQGQPERRQRKRFHSVPISTLGGETPRPA